MQIYSRFDCLMGLDVLQLGIWDSGFDLVILYSQYLHN